MSAADSNSGKPLSWFDGLGAIGSIASIIGLVLALMSPTPTVGILFGIVSITLGGFTFNYLRQIRKNEATANLIRNSQKKHQGEIIRQHYGEPPPPDLSATEWLEHKRRSSRTLITIVIVLAIVGIAAIGAVVLIERSKAQASLDELNGLRKQVDELRSRERKSLEVISSAHGQTSMLNRFKPSPELAELTKQLQAHLEFIEKTYGDRDWSEEEQFAIRLAKASVALNRGDFSAANDLVTASDLDSAERRTAAARADEIQALTVKADALSGMLQFSAAAKYYKRLLEVDPTPDREMDLANAYYYAGDYHNAETILQQMLTRLDKLHGHGDRQTSAWLAMGMANHGGILADTGDLGQAIKVLSTAVNVFDLISDDKGNIGLQLARAKTRLRRADAYSDFGDFENGIEDYRIAIVEIERLAAETNSEDVRIDLVLAKSNLATALVETGEITHALKELSGVFDMIRGSEKSDASLTLKNMHGSALNIRSTIRIIENEPMAAIDDLESSKALFAEVVETSHDRFAEFQLAHTCRLLGKLRWKHSDQDMAVSDLNQSRTLYERLLKKPTTYENIGSYCDLLLFLSQIMSESGALLKDISRIQQAEIAAQRAVALLEAGPKDVPRAQMNLLYGQSLASLALCETRLSKYDNAEGHFRKAIEVLAVAPARPSKLHNTQQDMLQSQLNLACVLAKQKKVNEAKIQFENCISGLRKFARDQDPAIKECLANALQIHGRVLAEQNEIPEAKNAMVESVRLFEELSSEIEAKRILPYLSRSRRHLRELEEGKALIEEPQIIK